MDPTHGTADFKAKTNHPNQIGKAADVIAELKQVKTVEENTV